MATVVATAVPNLILLLALELKMEAVLVAKVLAPSRAMAPQSAAFDFDFIV